MCDGHPGRSNNAKNWSWMSPADSKAMNATPYRAGPNARELEKHGIEKVDSKKVIKPAQTKWAVKMFSIRGKNGFLHFCVDYRKLNDVTKRDSNLIPCRDEYMH